MFTNREKRDMVKIFYACNRNSEVTSRRYEEAYPERRQPHRTYFIKLDKNLTEYGAFSKPRNAYGSRIPDNIKENILQEVSNYSYIILSLFYFHPPFCKLSLSDND
jgi:hypothetical protein